ncbi:hypothetical protein TELCIR_23798, partial [Teladorsagia circumcincta]
AGQKDVSCAVSSWLRISSEYVYSSTPYAYWFWWRIHDGNDALSQKKKVSINLPPSPALTKEINPL